MFLPFKENAFIKPSKLTEYLLSETHIVGKNKAFFFSKIGFNKSNINEFEQELLKFKDLEITDYIKIDFGIKYLIKGKINTPFLGKYKLITVWMLETNSKTPYLITSYPQ